MFGNKGGIKKLSTGESLKHAKKKGLPERAPS